MDHQAYLSCLIPAQPSPSSAMSVPKTARIPFLSCCASSVIGTAQCAVPTYKTHLEAKFFQIFWEFFTGGDCGVVLILGLYGSRSFDCSLFSHSLRIKSAEGGFGGPGLYQFVIRLRSVPISKYSLLNTLIYTRNYLKKQPNYTY